jgi:hypothetical protein
MLRRWVAALATFLFSSVALADGTTGKGTIVFLSAETGGVFIQIKGSTGNLAKADPDGCGRNYLFMLDKNHPTFNVLYAAILSAYATSSPMYLKLSGCSGASGNAWPLVSYATQGDYQAPQLNHTNLCDVEAIPSYRTRIGDFLTNRSRVPLHRSTSHRRPS